MRNAGLFLASAVMALVMVTSMVSLPATADGGSSVEMSSAGPVQVGDWFVEAADGTSTVATGTDPLTVDAVATESQTFTMATIGEPNFLDPAIDFEDAGAEVIQNVYQTLVWYDRESAINLVPVLATEVPSIENGLISANGMNCTFNLREDVVFHDGTADDLGGCHLLDPEGAADTRPERPRLDAGAGPHGLHRVLCR